MSNRFSKTSYYLAALLGLTLAFHASAQPGGGFGGGGGGSTGRRSTSSTTQYPRNGAIGDAYYSIDPETRRVVIIADEQTRNAVSLVLSNLDRPKPQVLIKVVFLEVDHNNASDIGVEGGWGKQVNSDPTKMSATSGFGLSGLTVPTTNFNSLGQPFNSFAAASPMTQTGAGLYQVLGTDYQVTVRAISQAGKARILSRPSILARNNQPATITVGQSVPLITSVRYDTFGNAINSYQYRDVGVVLKVTPFITPDNLVEMIVAPSISSLDPTVTATISAGVTTPAINIRSADTVAVTPSGQTVIIGGLMQATKAATDTKVPILGDIPLLGELFKRKQRSGTDSELMIFLTPYIVQNPVELVAVSERERRQSDATKSLNEEELNKFLDTIPTAPAPGAKKSGKNGSAVKPN